MRLPLFYFKGGFVKKNLVPSSKYAVKCPYPMEAELSDSKGIEKRNFAIDKAIAILEEKGIYVSKDKVISGIENGVYKLKNKQNHSH
ncbi:phage holin, LLH family [Cytobacillus horneckiae]|uniref:phage holin, LLH family n=1 Tax=Cytobacillus horneckiae TaxID=549687 RepID=UPI003D9A922C